MRYILVYNDNDDANDDEGDYGDARGHDDDEDEDVGNINWQPTS